MCAEARRRSLDERQFVLDQLFGRAADIFHASTFDARSGEFTLTLNRESFRLQGVIGDAPDENDGIPIWVEDPPKRLQDLTRTALAEKYGDGITAASDLKEFEVLTVISDGLQCALTEQSGFIVLWKE